MRLRTAARGGRVELKHEFKQNPFRVYRGGCWDNTASDARDPYANGVIAGGRYVNIGFRLVRDQVSPRENE